MTNWRVDVGDCREAMAGMPDGSIHATVTDPPYHLTQASRGGSARTAGTGPFGRHRVGEKGFMGKTWDGGGVAFTVELWAEVLRVMQSGAYLIAFGGTRTFHRLTCAIEDAGFEVRDCFSWLYGSGFPKHASALKPAWEPIILARKPAPKATALNIDACRLACEPIHTTRNTALGVMNDDGWEPQPGTFENHPLGRWPANVIVDEDAARLVDEQSGDSRSPGTYSRSTVVENRIYGASNDRPVQFGFGDSGGVSRFYYCAKASREERDAGCAAFAKKPLNWSAGTQNPGSFQSAGTDKTARNAHPTVKPLDLMRWLVRLVTPPNGVVLDPFCGSGTTGCAAVLEGRGFVGIERDSEYAEIARARVAHWAEQYQPGLFDVA